jgi:large subunit ribosomal protein L2
MYLCSFRASTPAGRHIIWNSFEEITSKSPEKKLLRPNHRASGRNHRGVITCRHRGGGHKRLYRKIDFRRKKLNQSGKILSIEYDPNRSSHLALVKYQDNTKNYILSPKSLLVGKSIISGFRVPIEVGNALPLENYPLGVTIHGVELIPRSGRKLVRAGGTGGYLVRQEGNFATVRLPSGEDRILLENCWATVGQVGNEKRKNKRFGRAGSMRWLGLRPSVRGKAINPVDHPHGGGEGRNPIGHPYPITPWGKVRLGVKTRRLNLFLFVFDPILFFHNPLNSFYFY